VKFKFLVGILTLVFAALFAQIVNFIFGNQVDAWSIRFAIAAAFAFIGYMWGQGKLAEFNKEDWIFLLFVAAVYVYVMSAVAVLIVIFVPAFLIAIYLTSKFIRD
jgi:hypothetical protein